MKNDNFEEDCNCGLFYTISALKGETYTTQTMATQTMALMMTMEGEMLLTPATIFEIR